MCQLSYFQTEIFKYKFGIFELTILKEYTRPSLFTTTDVLSIKKAEHRASTGIPETQISNFRAREYQALPNIENRASN